MFFLGNTCSKLFICLKATQPNKITIDVGNTSTFQWSCGCRDRICETSAFNSHSDACQLEASHREVFIRDILRQNKNYQAILGHLEAQQGRLIPFCLQSCNTPLSLLRRVDGNSIPYLGLPPLPAECLIGLSWHWSKCIQDPTKSKWHIQSHTGLRFLNLRGLRIARNVNQSQGTALGHRCRRAKSTKSP